MNTKIYMKPQHDFIKQTTAFLETIDYKSPKFNNQYKIAAWWMNNQEKIVKAIPSENERLKPHFLRMFTQISIRAKYLNEINTEQICTA